MGKYCAKPGTKTLFKWVEVMRVSVMSLCYILELRSKSIFELAKTTIKDLMDNDLVKNQRRKSLGESLQTLISLSSQLHP